MQVNEDTRRMLNFAIKAVKALVVILLIISILYFFVLKLSIDSIRDLQRFTSTFSVIMISLLKIVAVLLVFALLLMLGLWLFRKEDGVEILPFIVAKGEEDRYSGQAISDLLAAEFERIRRIHSVRYEGIRPTNSEGLNLQLLDPKCENLPYLRIFESGTMNPSPAPGPDPKILPKLVTGVGTNTISVGEILIILKQLCPGRYSKSFISGSLQRYGSSIILVARFQDSKNTFIWEVTHKQEGQDQDETGYIPSLVSDLSFKIINDLLAEDKHLSEFMVGDTWLGFKHFTESLNEFQQYKLTGDIKHLDLAKENCLEAANIDRWYGKIYALLYNLGIAYLNEGKSTYAKELFVKVVEHRPDDYAFVNLGNVHGLLGKIDPEEAYLWNNKGNAFLELGRTEEAIEAYEKAIEIDPKLVRALLDMGLVLGGLGRHKEALERFNEVIRIDPENASALYNKGIALGKLGRMQEAIEAIEKAIELYPKYVSAWHLKGLALVDLGRTEEAIEAFEKAIDIDPRDAHVWCHKGIALGELGRMQEAIEAIENAIKLDSKYVVAYISLSRLYRKQGREADSIEKCKLARSLIENEKEYNRACFEVVCGSPDAALALLRTALEKKQQTADWARQDPDFEFIRDDPRFKALLDEFSEDGKRGPE